MKNCGVVGMVLATYAEDPGSIPRQGNLFLEVNEKVIYFLQYKSYC